MTLAVIEWASLAVMLVTVVYVVLQDVVYRKKASRHLEQMAEVHAALSVESPTLQGEAAEARNGKSRKVLFVDDDPQIKGILPMLSDYGIKVEVAGGADEAMEKLKLNGYDAVVTDYKMPFVDGFELCDRIKAEHPEIRRIVYSAYSPKDEAISAMNRGAVHAYIAKPWNNERLVDVINDKTRERRSSHLQLVGGKH